MATDKNYTIKLGFIATGFKDAADGVDRINDSLKGTAASVSGFSDRVDALTGKVIRDVTIQKETFEGLEQDAKKAYSSFAGSNIQGDVSISLIEKTKVEAERFKQIQKEKEEYFRDSIERSRIDALHGSDSLVKLKYEEKQKILQIEREKQEALQSLQNKTLHPVVLSGAIRGIESTAAEKITSAQQPVIQKTNETVLAQEEANQLKQIQQKELAQLNAFIEEQKRIRVNGENSTQAKVAEIARRELTIRQTLAEELKSIQSQVANSTIDLNVGKGLQSSTIEQAKEQLTALAQELPKAGQQVNTLGDHFIRLAKHVAEVYIAWGIMNAVTAKFSEAIHGIIPAGIALDSTFSSLVSTVGSEAGATATLSKLREEASRTGIEISAVRKSFAGFQASTSLAGADLDSTWRMFTNINTVITALHKTTDEANHIFLAMAQIFNKSKVQSEELVKQLGNLLPGAFAAFAASQKITTEELTIRMKAGTEKAKQTMEGFTQYMADRFSASFGIAATMVNADINRMNSSFTILGETIYQQTSGPLQKIIQGITSLSDSFAHLVKDTTVIGDTINLIFNTAVASGVGYLTSLAIKADLVGKSLAFLSSGVVGLTTVAATLGKVVTSTNVLVSAIAFVALHLKDLFDEALDPMERVLKTMEEIAKQKEKMANKGIEPDIYDDPKVQVLQQTIKDLRKVREDLDGAPVWTSFKIPDDIAKQYKQLVDSSKDISGWTRAANAVEYYDKIIVKAKEALKYAKDAAQISLDDAKSKALQQQVDSAATAKETAISIADDVAKAKGKVEDATFSAQTQKYKKAGQEAENAIKENIDILAKNSKSLTEIQIETLKTRISEAFQTQSDIDLTIANNVREAGEKALKTFNDKQSMELKVYREAEYKKIKADYESQIDKLVGQQKELEQLPVTERPVDYRDQERKIAEKINDLKQKEYELTIKVAQADEQSQKTLERKYTLLNSLSKEQLFQGIANVESPGYDRTKGVITNQGGNSSARGPEQIVKGTYNNIKEQNPELNLPDFYKATNDELEVASKRLYTTLLDTYKDATIALYAYFQGGPKTDSELKKAGVTKGDNSTTAVEAANKQFTQDTPGVSGKNLSWAAYQDKYLKGLGLKNDLEKQTVQTLKDQTKEAETLELKEKSLAELQAKKAQIAKQETVDLKGYRQLLDEINYKTLQSEGRLEEAQAARYQKQFAYDEQVITHFAEQGDEQSKVGLAQLKILEAQWVAAGKIQTINKEIALAKTVEQEKEQQNLIDLKSNYITEAEYIKRNFDAKQQEIQVVRDQLSAENGLNLTLQQRVDLEKQLKDLTKNNTDQITAANQIMARGQQSTLGSAVNTFMADRQTIEGARKQSDAKAESEYVIAAAGKTTDQQWQLHQDMLNKKSKADTQYSLLTAKSYSDLFAGVFKSGADTFEALTEMNVRMYGADSKQAKQSFAIWKEMKVAEVVSSTASAAINAYSSMAAIPYIGPALGVVAAAAAVAFGAAQISKVEGTKMPSAHGGLTEVPKEQTYLLDKGERVLSPNQNKDLTKFMQNNGSSSSKQPVVNLQVHNNFDKSITLDHLNSPEGAKIIMNTVRREAA